MPNLGITEYVHKVDTVAQHALGTRVVIPARAVDSILYYVDASGVVVGGAQEWYKPASTDVAVKLEGGSGDMEWVYVENGSGSAIERGQLASVSAGSITYEVERSPNGAPAISVAGVAQHQIPAGQFGWVLAKGVGVVLTNATAAAAGVGLKPSTTVGSAVTISAGDESVAMAIEANGSAAVRIKARINSPLA